MEEPKATTPLEGVSVSEGGELCSPHYKNKADRIRSMLAEEFAPSRLVIYDESAQHAGHSGARAEGETHFRIEITSQKFTGLSRVACHRMVNDVLRPLFQEGLHALSIQAKDR